jgi:hypothetical protein
MIGVVGFLLVVVGVAIVIAAVNAAYRNGVTDGYGFSVEPNCPGYRKAGAYLKKYMAHRWAELRQETPKHFFEYLSPANKPVIPGLEGFEVVYAKDQPEYIPLRTLRSRTDEGKVMSRWDLTPEQRKAVANGADLFLTLLTFQGPLQPITLAVATDINPDYIRLDYNLNPNETLQSQLRKM